MFKDFVFLKASINQVCQSLRTEPLASLGNMASFSAEFNAISAWLHFGILPRPEKINTLSAGLWLTKMRMANLSGGQSAAMLELERLVDLLERVTSILKECWLYREWTSSRASTIVSVVAIAPAFLVFWATGPVPLCSVIVAFFLGVITLISLWIKDSVGVFWSFYSYFLLYVIASM